PRAHPGAEAREHPRDRDLPRLDRDGLLRALPSHPRASADAPPERRRPGPPVRPDLTAERPGRRDRAPPARRVSGRTSRPSAASIIESAMASILLVDDSGLFRGAAEEVLRRTGCETLNASSGTEALDVARHARPQMIVVKAGMTRMTGLDLCRVLKADPAFAKTPIAVVTLPGTEEEARRAGADAVLPLPLDPESFFAVIRRYLQVVPREEARAAV